MELPDAERELTIAALQNATRVLVHQVSDLNRLRALGLAANVTYFPHGAPRRFDAPPARRIDPDSAPVIGSYGFFLPGKGLPRLIEALPALRKRWPRIRLRLNNAHYPSQLSDEEIARCRQLADSLGVTELIAWNIEFQPDAVSLQQLSACDLLVLPYDESSESASGAVRIALASGAPVAVTPANIFSELGAAVSRFDDMSSDATSRGIEHLLANRELRAQLQADAAAWLKQRDWSELGARLKGMIAGLHTERLIGRVSAAATAQAAGPINVTPAPQNRLETA
jgi:glycosyltransferase involved in cell wall biosynthesis